MKTSSLTSLIRSAVLWSGVAFATIAQAQPTINNVSPDGSVLFQASPTFSFLASSPAGITNVTVALNSKRMNGTTSFQNLTSAHGLTLTGPNTGETVTAALTSNRLYTATITILDASGASANSTVTFDTITPSYTFEAEDWNYTDTNDFSAGHYFDNPQTNAYAGLATTRGQDANALGGNNNLGNGQQAYRPGGSDETGGLATESTGDIPKRADYQGTGKTDYDVGWTDGGEYAFYTRHFPAGTYNIFLRAANGNASGTDNAEIWNAGTKLGQFDIPKVGDWQTYSFVPMTDGSGNLVAYTFDGSEQTLQLSYVNANCNVNFVLFLPLDTNTPPAGDISITNVYPDGTFQFQATNTFAFNITSSVNVNAGDITVVVNATNLLQQGTSQSLTSGSGLTVGGTPTSRTVTLALSSNMMYSVAISVLDVDNNATSANVVFDTITPAYTFEAEDWNYGGGMFVDNPQTNAYSGQDGSTDIDYHRAGGNGGNAYGGRIGLSTENASDVPRVTHVGLDDFDIGNSFGGNWANYTRTFPAGTYNIYVRASRGDGGSVVNAASISSVTGADTSNQTVSELGTFDVPNTGGWQKYTWVPVKNSNGNLVYFTGGGVETLRYTVNNAGHNPNFFMLLPADLSQLPPPFVSGFQPDGTAVFQFTNQLSFSANSLVGMPAANIVVQLDGVTVTNLTVSGTPSLWSVSCPVRTNALQTAVITLTDGAGTSTVTKRFATFDPNNITFEAEDFNYGSGQFFDNPYIDQYAYQNAVLGVDYNCGSQNANAYNRVGLSVEGCSDLLRPGWFSGQDYDVGWNDGGNWANFTRTFPAGIYNVYVRASDPNQTGSTDSIILSRVTSDRTQPNQTTASLGTFSFVPTGDWQNFTFVPLKAANGTLAQVVTDGSATTLRETVGSGGGNVNFYMLVPVSSDMPASIGSFQPDGSALFQATNQVTITVTSPAGVTTNHIVVTVDGVTVTNLAFSGSANVWNVVCPVSTNATHAIVVTVTDANGTVSSTSTVTTYSGANYQWEAEDYDFGGGQYFDNPQVNAYTNRAPVADIDNHQSDLSGHPFLYRPNSPTAPVPSSDLAGELPRALFTSGGGTGTDYNIGFFGGGSWVNYTRHYPSGTYYVLGRFAEGAALTQPSLALVTSGVGTTNQALQPLGIFPVLPAGWSSWQWATLADSAGKPVKVTFDSSATTLRYSGSALPGQPECNTGFFMLVPTVPDLKLKAVLGGGNITISFPTQTGLNYQVLFKTHLSDATWAPLGSSVPGNGLVHSVQYSTTGPSGFYRVQAQ